MFQKNLGALEKRLHGHGLSFLFVGSLFS
jgi:hypothetical protein